MAISRILELFIFCCTFATLDKFNTGNCLLSNEPKKRENQFGGENGPIELNRAMASQSRAFLPRLADGLHKAFTATLVAGTVYTGFFLVDMGYHQIKEVKHVNARIKAGDVLLFF